MAEQAVGMKAVVTPQVKGGTVEIHLANDVKLETLRSIVETIPRISGCTTCGLVGIDLILRGGDPVELGAIRNLPGVTGVNVVR